MNAMGDFSECVGMEATNVTFKSQALQDKYAGMNIPTSFGGRYCTVYLPFNATYFADDDNTTMKIPNPMLRESVSPEELLVILKSLAI